MVDALYSWLAGWMDNLDFLPVRFQLVREFVIMEKIIDSVRVHEAWSYIVREKVPVCEIVANSKGHMIITKKEKGFSLWGSSLYGHIKKEVNVVITLTSVYRICKFYALMESWR
jgi:hypothetical protein